MGLDLYIEAKITEKATGKCISIHNTKDVKKYWFEPNGSVCEDYQYFHVHWMGSHDAYPVRDNWIDIINRYMKTAHGYDDRIMPFPQSALREMCSCLYSYMCPPESNRFQWEFY